jgi:polysaccharide biosynthesis/export protein
MAALLLALGGCASTPPLASNEHLIVTDASALGPPTRADSAQQERPYIIGPYDKLLVDVYGVAELSREVQADGGGRISIPLAGVIDAAGKTPGELATVIQERLRGYVREPHVTVNLKETLSQVVTVDGEVKEPGLYPVVGGMTLMNAVARAKGTTEFAKLEDVVIFRTVNNQRMAALYNLAAIRRGIYEDPQVYANDVVIVGNSSARRLFRDILQAAPLLTTPIIGILQTR